MQRTHHLFFGYEAVVKHQFRRGRTTHPNFINFLANGETLHAFFNQKRGNAARRSLRCGFGIDNQSVSIRRVSDPIFGAVQDIAALNRFGLQLH